MKTMFDWIKKFFGNKSKKKLDANDQPVKEPLEDYDSKKDTPSSKKVRARDERGRWLPDDPATEKNEAYK